jgi:hypothetical protein
MEQILIKSDNKRAPKKENAYSKELDRRMKEMQAYKGEK